MLLDECLSLGEDDISDLKAFLSSILIEIKYIIS